MTFTSKEKAAFVGDAAIQRRMRSAERLTDAKMAVCDGDTDAEVKAKIKKQRTQILLTNPDSLHHAMLRHKSWGKTLGRSHAVFDEAHTQEVSGAHVANVLRRLLSARVLNSTVRPEFICRGDDFKQSNTSDDSPLNLRA